MNSSLRKISGSVKLIHCTDCNATIPMFAFEGESDTDTIGLCSAGCCNAYKLALFEVTIDEWNVLRAQRTNDLPSRINQELNGLDYRMSHILRVDRFDEPPAGTSFAEFRRQYKAPQVIYLCPCCGGEGVVNEEITVEQFKKLGGSICTLGNLILY